MGKKHSITRSMQNRYNKYRRSMPYGMTRSDFETMKKTTPGYINPSRLRKKDTEGVYFKSPLACCQDCQRFKGNICETVFCDGDCASCKQVCALFDTKRVRRESRI